MIQHGRGEHDGKRRAKFAQKCEVARRTLKEYGNVPGHHVRLGSNFFRGRSQGCNHGANR